jgi:threonine/homoserine/homoserine lactone efflux protein
VTASIFASGLVLGISIAAPVGAMGLLCINRTLQQGLGAGLCVGAGIATGDALYGAVAAFGFSALTDFLIRFALPLRLLGGGFLIWLGIKAWRDAGAPRSAREAAAPRGIFRDYAAAVALTLTNPATILSFIAAFSALSLASRGGAGVDGEQGAAGWLVAGVFAGSAAWWIGLCTCVSVVRHAISPKAMMWIDRLSAVILILFGACAAVGLL